MASLSSLVKKGVTKVRIESWERFAFLELSVVYGRLGKWGKLHADRFTDNTEPRPFPLFMASDGAWLPWDQFTDKEWVAQMGNDVKVACCPGHARIRDGIMPCAD